MQEIKTTADLKNVFSSKFNNDKSENQEEFYRYAIYVRKSTDTEDKQERSLGDQLADCEELVLRHSLRVVKVIQESMSAKEPDIRPKYREMMNDLQAGKYDGIIAWHPNRLSRNMREAGEIIDLLDKNIIKDLKFVSYTHTNDASGKMLLGITFVMSKQFSDNLSDSVTRGNRRSIEEGKYINKAKHGYKKDRNGYLRPDGKNFTLVTEAFQLRLQGKTIDEIATFLNKNGYSRQNSISGKSYTAHMQKAMAGKFMRDPVYTGVMVYGETVVDLTEVYDFVPAVSVEDFMKINRLEKNSDIIKLAKSFKRTGGVKADLLRGKVLCAGCGEQRMAGITTKELKSEAKNYFYYRCDTEGCPFENKSTRAKVILDFVMDYFKKRPFSNVDAYQHYKVEMVRVMNQRLKEKQDLLRVKKSELAKLQSRIVDLKSAMVLEKDEEVKGYQKEDFQKTTDRVVVVNAEFEKLEKQIEAVKGTPMTYQEFLELFDNMASILKKTTKMSDLDTLLQKFFLNFTINKKSVEEYTLNEPFASLESIETSNVSLGAR
ncbi:recombinase family protein [Candidatus Kaiserbacteria bacterium]|nr:MAG: recombinase family protein [Candidatus Kaiserbacteria bacterium]